jgi:hypothetical protein
VRDIDAILEAVRREDRIPPIIKQVLINRIEPRPTPEEIERARQQVYPELAAAAGEDGLLTKRRDEANG